MFRISIFGFRIFYILGRSQAVRHPDLVGTFVGSIPTAAYRNFMYHTYVLENPSGKMYIGQSNDLSDRLKRHNGNRVKSTKNKGPWKIVYSKQFSTRTESVNYEAYLKSLKNSRYIKQVFVEGTYIGA